LTTVVLSDNIEEIGSGPFQGCDKLSTLIIPSDFKYGIYYLLNSGCPGGEDWSCNPTIIITPQGDKKIYDGLWDFKTFISSTVIVLKEGIIAIEDAAFQNCDELVEIIIPNTVSRIGERAFMDCENLRSIKIPNGVQKIEEGTFSGCTRLKSITLPDTILNINEDAFDGCVQLESIYISGTKLSDLKQMIPNYADKLKIINTNLPPHE